jgi:SAM-dependent methyltransferase
LYRAHRDRSAVTLKRKHIRQFDREFAELTQAQPSMSVLEIGCGAGLFLRYLEARRYRTIIGVDSDPGLAGALADLRVAKVHLDDIRRVLDRPLAGRQFDRIVLFDVAEHLEFGVLVDLLKRLKAALADDGRILLRTPNLASPFGAAVFYGSFDHVTPLSPERMREIGVLVGLECLGVYPQEPVPILRRWRQRAAFRLLEWMASHHPEAWTANLLAVYGRGKA